MSYYIFDRMTCFEKDNEFLESLVLGFRVAVLSGVEEFNPNRKTIYAFSPIWHLTDARVIAQIFLFWGFSRAYCSWE